MIWIADDGVLHEGYQRWLAGTVVFPYRWFDTDLSKLSSVDDLTSYYIESKKGNSPTKSAQELKPGLHDGSVIKNAWSFAHEINIGDYVVIGCMGTLHVGRISGPYNFAIDGSGKGVHSYPITHLTNLVNKYQYPREMRHLFRDTRFGQIADPRIERLLDPAVAATLPPEPSIAHLMFEEMSESIPNQHEVGELALDYVLDIINGPEHCDACQRVCVEVIHLDEENGSLNHPHGLFVPWDALSDLKERIQWVLDNEGLERVRGESDIAMVWRYLDNREDGSHLASYNLETGYPLLIGLRRDDQELWGWLMVDVDSSGYDASLTDAVAPSRELAEPLLRQLGFRKSSEIDVERLKRLGFVDPEGQHLEKESID